MYRKRLSGFSLMSSRNPRTRDKQEKRFERACRRVFNSSKPKISPFKFEDQLAAAKNINFFFSSRNTSTSRLDTSNMPKGRQHQMLKITNTWSRTLHLNQIMLLLECSVVPAIILIPLHLQLMMMPPPPLKFLLIPE